MLHPEIAALVRFAKTRKEWALIFIAPGANAKTKSRLVSKGTDYANNFYSFTFPFECNLAFRDDLGRATQRRRGGEFCAAGIAGL